MSYKSNTKYSPRNSPTLYRRASLSDISDPKILGFYEYNGQYYRKNGAVRYDGPFPVVTVRDTPIRTRSIAAWNYNAYFVRLDEILSEENAPPKHFKLVRITVDVRDSEGLQKFACLLGARGYLHEAQQCDERYSYEMSLFFLEPILVPPTLLLNLFDDCIAAQPGWGEEE